MQLTFWKKPEQKLEGRSRLFYSPFADMEKMMSEMFNRYWGINDENGLATFSSPAFNVYRDGDNMVIEARVPGYSKEEITVELNDDVLTVSGEHREEKEEKNEEKKFFYREFKQGSFSRSIRLPSKVDPASLKAKHADGVLKITLPAPEDQEKGHKIEIE